MSEFENWFKNNYPNIETTSAYAKLPNKAWQAAAAESDKRIAELEAHINVLCEALKYQKTRCEDVIDIRLIDEALASTPAQSEYVVNSGGTGTELRQPAQKWVGLSDDEIFALCPYIDHDLLEEAFYRGARAVETKLKELNHES